MDTDKNDTGGGWLAGAEAVWSIVELIVLLWRGVVAVVGVIVEIVVSVFVSS